MRRPDMKNENKLSKLKNPDFFTLRNEEKLNKIIHFMLNNKTRDCASTAEVAKKFKMSTSSALRYLKHFTNSGDLIRDNDNSNLFWINKEK